MIAYRPVGNFNLRDFHHAVNNLPSDAFLPDIDTVSGAGSITLYICVCMCFVCEFTS